MAKKFEIRNSTAEFLIFMAESKKVNWIKIQFVGISDELPLICLRTGTIHKKTDVGIRKCNGDRYMTI